MAFNLDPSRHRPYYVTDAQWEKYLADLVKYKQYSVWEIINDDGTPGVTYEPKYSFEEWAKLQ
jgi:hypothetical protein